MDNCASIWNERHQNPEPRRRPILGKTTCLNSFLMSSLLLSILSLVCVPTSCAFVSQQQRHTHQLNVALSSQSSSITRTHVKSYMFNGGSGSNDNTSGSGKNNSAIGGGLSGGLQMLQNQQQQLKNEWTNQNEISTNAILDKLEMGQISFPFRFEMKEKFSLNTKRTIQIRQMELEDLQQCVSLCLKEYGKYSSPSTKSKSSFMNKVQSKLDDLDNFVFSFVVLYGMEQRVKRRLQGDAMSGAMPQDHNVVILSEIVPCENCGDDKNMQGKSKEIIFGMAEISLQPADPSRTSPPFVIPTQFKTILSSSAAKKGNNGKNKNQNSLCAYVSNVLITNEYRSKGYSKVLMAACHGLARSWGYESTYLHVDADYKSGRAAQQLYRKLGYKPFVDETYNEQFAWMGIESVNRGLYIVDGVPLLFLKKDL